MGECLSLIVCDCFMRKIQTHLKNGGKNDHKTQNAALRSDYAFGVNKPQETKSFLSLLIGTVLILSYFTKMSAIYRIHPLKCVQLRSNKRIALSIHHRHNESKQIDTTLFILGADYTVNASLVNRGFPFQLPGQKHCM